MKKTTILMLIYNILLLYLHASEKTDLLSNKTLNDLMPEIITNINTYLEPFEQSKMRLVNSTINNKIQELTNLSIEKTLNNFFLYPNENLSKKKLYLLLESNTFAQKFFYNHFLEKANCDYFNGVANHDMPEKMLRTILDGKIINGAQYYIITYKNLIKSSGINTICRINFTKDTFSENPDILNYLLQKWVKNKTEGSNARIRLMLDHYPGIENGEFIVGLVHNLICQIEEYRNKDISFYNALKIIDCSCLFSFISPVNISPLISPLCDLLFKKNQFSYAVPLSFYWEMYRKVQFVHSHVIPYPSSGKIMRDFEQSSDFLKFLSIVAGKYNLGLEIIKKFDNDLRSQTIVMPDENNYCFIHEKIEACKTLQCYMSPFFLQDKKGLSLIMFLLKLLFNYFNNCYLNITENTNTMKNLIDLIRTICIKHRQKAAHYRPCYGNSLAHLIFNIWLRPSDLILKKYKLYEELVNLILDLPIDINHKNFTGERVLECFIKAFPVQLSPINTLKIFKHKGVNFKKRFSDGKTPLNYLTIQLNNLKNIMNNPPNINNPQNTNDQLVILLNKIGTLEIIQEYISKELDKTQSKYPW